MAVAVANLFDIKPNSNHFYFQNFWQLDNPSRLKKFEDLNNKGLIALYSIACDLNVNKKHQDKNGSFANYKEWRNKLEHSYLVIYRGEIPIDIFESRKYLNEMEYVEETEFLKSFENILQLTRSAIYSFVFSVREKAIRETEAFDTKSGVKCPTLRLERKNFKQTEES
ncbi:LA2681 family HEPN domain-containing protein [Acinetobacter sp. c1-l78]|uniref:LA2681 family HEPN domain-containing protein n=1 Tax=Acinetobacter sp. c1-l78 TaxID=3342803 RepID=UPI0035B9D46A